MIDDRRVIDATRVVPKTRGSMDHNFDAGETPLKARLESCLSPSLRLEFLQDRIGLVRPRHGRCKAPTFFSFLLRLLSFSFSFLFFLSRVHRFRAALQAQRTAERPGSDQPWPSTDWARIRYKNGSDADDIARDPVDYLGRLLTRCYREFMLRFCFYRSGKLTCFCIAP